MTIPTTGLISLFGVFVYFYLSIKFYRCYKEEDNRIAKFFSYGFFLIGLNYVVETAPILFFIDDLGVWRILAPFYVCFMTSGWVLIAYAVFSSVLPSYSKAIGVFFSCIVLLSVFPFLFYTPKYFYVNGVLDWSFESIPHVAPFFFVPFVFTPLILSSMIIIFFLKAKNAQNRKVKIRSLGLAIAMFFMLLGMFVDLILITVGDVHPVYSDLNYLVVFTILAFTLIFSWFPPKSKYVTKIE